MTLRVKTLIWAAVLASAAGAETTPYAGQQTRAVASLSVQDVDDLLARRGWGFAKPADLIDLPAQAADIASELRAAHLETLPSLTRHQVMTYNNLRAYGDGIAGHDTTNEEPSI